MDPAALGALLDRENLLILVTRPGEERALCGGLIAEACARGRPPLVAVLTDGSRTPPTNDPDAQARAHAAAVTAAVAALGLPEARLFLLGLHDGTAPADGPQFEALAGGLRMLMWMRDCGVIAAPAGNATGDHAAAAAVAARVQALLGVRRIGYALDAVPPGLPWQAARRAAAPAAHAAAPAAAERWLA